MAKLFPRYLSRIVLALAVLAGGLGAFNILFPYSREIAYQTDPKGTFCAAGQCHTFYRLSIGNTGAYPDDSVDITLILPPAESRGLPLKVMTFGKLRYPADITETEKVTHVRLGMLKPSIRVEVSFSLLNNTASQSPDWDDILKDVKSSQSRVIRSSPETLRFARFLYSFFGI